MTAAASDSTLTSALGANRFHRNPCLDQEGLNAFGSVLAEGLIGFLSSYSISVPDQTHRRGRILEQERHDRIRRGRQRLAIDRGTSDLPVSKPSIVTEPLSAVPSRSGGDLLGKSSQEPLCKRPLGRFPEV